jgi:hypothetical protein
MPTSLTALEFACSAVDDEDEWDADPHAFISLHAALSAAVACIRGGARLQSLTLAHCTTLAHDEEEGSMVELREGEVQQLYAPLATALRGLVHLDLSPVLSAAGCGEAAVNEVVSSAPSLKSLVLRMGKPLVAHSTWLACSGLSELHLDYQAWQRASEEDVLYLTYYLGDTAAMRSCTLELSDLDLSQGDRITFVLGCHEMAGVTEFVERMPFSWLLGLKVHIPEGARDIMDRQVRVTYVCVEDGATWAFAVERRGLAYDSDWCAYPSPS